MIPVKYNVRNLRVRWVTTLMTVLGIALVVWASVLSFGLIDGLEHALTVTGNELDLIVLRKGSQEEISSGIEQTIAGRVDERRVPRPRRTRVVTAVGSTNRARVAPPR